MLTPMEQKAGKDAVGMIASTIRMWKPEAKITVEINGEHAKALVAYVQELEETNERLLGNFHAACSFLFPANIENLRAAFVKQFGEPA